MDRLPRLRTLTSDRWHPAYVTVVAAGVVLRIAFLLGIRPISYGLNDSGTYMAAANGLNRGLWSDVHHPTGYGVFLRVVSPVVQSGTGLAVLQHLLGILAGIAIIAAARRLGAAPVWAALIGAGYLVNIDVAALEHAVLSEAVFLPMLAVFVLAAATLYARPTSTGRAAAWAAVLGLSAALAYTMRYSGVALPLAALALVVILTSGSLKRRALGVAATVLAALVVLVPYVAEQDRVLGTGVTLLPGAGWSAYSNIAAQADCTKFTPPRGTRILCQRPEDRVGRRPEFFSWDPSAPAFDLEPRGYPFSDSKFRAFADAVVRAIPSASTAKPLPERFIDAAGIVFGSLPPAPELAYRAPAVEDNERENLATGLLTLSPMSFHAPLSVLEDLRPFLRMTGPIALLLVLGGLVVGLRRGRSDVRLVLLLLTLGAVISAWTVAGQLPRYAVPIYLLCLPFGAVLLSAVRRDGPGRVPPALGGAVTEHRTGDLAPDRDGATARPDADRTAAQAPTERDRHLQGEASDDPPRTSHVQG